MKQTGKNRHDFVWNHIPSPEALGRIRMAAMEQFLSDYPLGIKQGRYISGNLPELPFCNNIFDIVLCSHLLFTYSEFLTADFHIDSIKEMCRVAGEVRVFPLPELEARKSRYIDHVLERLKRDGLDFRIVSVGYEFQKGGNKMLRITNKKT